MSKQLYTCDKSSNDAYYDVLLTETTNCVMIKPYSHWNVRKVVKSIYSIDVPHECECNQQQTKSIHALDMLQI